MNCRLPISLPVAVLIVVSSAPAQVRGARMSAPAPRTGIPFRPGVRPGFAQRHPRRFFPGGGFPYLYDYGYYPDYDYDYYPDYDYRPQGLPPRENPAQAAPPPAPAAPPPEPLMLEYQGDQWVRVQSYGQPAAGAALSEASPPPPRLPPAVLVFRDGHKEEVETYTIMGAVIYTSADYYRTGSWTREVRIAELDVPATLKLNQERGGKLTLPSGPNEIVIRP